MATTTHKAPARKGRAASARPKAKLNGKAKRAAKKPEKQEFVNVLYIPKTLHPIEKVAGDGDGRLALQNIRLVPGDEDFRLEATNGKIALVVRANNHPDLRQRPTKLKGLFLRIEGNKPEALLNARYVGKFLRMAETPCVAVRVGAVETGFTTGSDDMVLPNSTEPFPTIEHVIPKRAPQVAFHINAKYMMDLLRVFESLTPSDEESDVQLLFYGDGFPVGLAKVIRHGDIVLDGLIMPIDVAKR